MQTPLNMRMTSIKLNMSKKTNLLEMLKEEESKTDIEDMDLTTGLVLSQDLSVDNPYIHFIFGDQQGEFGDEQRRIVRDSDLMVQVRQGIQRFNCTSTQFSAIKSSYT
eukprot:TRINITY_DN8751_c0_g2_i3.p1 TRINITY_DN8751_c0_g2~~TRINITY_DN8751_c0_g2_i3.p1  ORF type:complete len:108 (-),score=17.02 TRINITY_DN8751_c0_g2_i3:321-644(-)